MCARGQGACWPRPTRLPRPRVLRFTLNPHTHTRHTQTHTHACTTSTSSASLFTRLVLPTPRTASATASRCISSLTRPSQAGRSRETNWRVCVRECCLSAGEPYTVRRQPNRRHGTRRCRTHHDDDLRVGLPQVFDERAHLRRALRDAQVAIAVLEGSAVERRRPWARRCPTRRAAAAGTAWSPLAGACPGPHPC